MSEAILPLLGYIILQFVVMIVGFNVVRDRELGTTGLLKSWVFGQMLCFAVLQFMAVPMILLHWKFNALFWIYVIFVTMLLISGFIQLLTDKKKIRIKLHKLSPTAMLILMVAVLLIVWQSCTYLFGIHLDEDDSRFLAEANDALTYGDMMNRSFHTGELDTAFTVPRDVSSPWPMMYAVVSRVLHTRPSVFAHTIYAPVEVILMYAVYWLLGAELFRKREARLTFLLAVELVILFFGGSVYTQATFSLVRIWQGKATLAGVLVPLMLYLLIRVNNSTRDIKVARRLKRPKENVVDIKSRRKSKGRILDTSKETWIALFITYTAACLMSGMGISLGLVLLGIFGVYNVLAYRNWREIPKWAVVALPGIACTLVFALVS